MVQISLHTGKYTCPKRILHTSRMSRNKKNQDKKDDDWWWLLNRLPLGRLGQLSHASPVLSSNFGLPKQNRQRPDHIHTTCIHSPTIFQQNRCRSISVLKSLSVNHRVFWLFQKVICLVLKLSRSYRLSVHHLDQNHMNFLNFVTFLFVCCVLCEFPEFFLFF